MKGTDTIVVTRHKALIEYIFAEGIAEEGTEVIPHAGASEVAGRHVIGVLPIQLAALAKSVTVIPIKLDRNDRGRELSLEEVYLKAQDPETYVVRRTR